MIFSAFFPKTASMLPKISSSSPRRLSRSHYYTEGLIKQFSTPPFFRFQRNFLDVYYIKFWKAFFDIRMNNTQFRWFLFKFPFYFTPIPRQLLSGCLWYGSAELLVRCVSLTFCLSIVRDGASYLCVAVLYISISPTVYLTRTRIR